MRLNKKCYLGLGAMLITGVVSAGLIQPARVIVEEDPSGGGFAFGDMASARFANNDIEFIGCGIRVFSGGFSFGFCQARDADGQRGFCSTEDPELLAAMHATSDNSFLTFAWDENEECTRIGFSTQSFYIPTESGKNNTNKRSNSQNQ